MYIVGLTGGIGSGKSEAARQFAKLGVPIVDTDAIAHSLTATGAPLFDEVAQLFGAGFLNTDGSLNRAKLRAHILNQPDERLKLEGLLHPAIYNRALELLNEHERLLNPAYQIIVVPLLFENDRYKKLVSRSIVIDCTEDEQIKRVMARSQLSAQEVLALIQIQINRSQRLKLADEVIENDGSMNDLVEKVTNLHKKLIKTCIVSK